MPLVAIEGPDGLGKSTIASYLVSHAESFGIEAEVVVPEPSKRFGRHPDALAWGWHLLKRYKDVPERLVILDRFPIPSEFIYGRPQQVQTSDPQYLRVLEDLSYTPLQFVYVFPSLELVKALFPDPESREDGLAVYNTIVKDPMFQGDIYKWLAVTQLYAAWACHNNNRMLRLERKLGKRWSHSTANKILDWLGYKVF